MGGQLREISGKTMTIKLYVPTRQRLAKHSAKDSGVKNEDIHYLIWRFIIWQIENRKITFYIECPECDDNFQRLSLTEL